MDNKAIERGIPFGAYEFVDVTFTAANTDTIVPYTLRTDDPESIRWIDISRGSVYSGSETPGHVFRSGNSTRKNWAPSYLVLQSSVAGYATRLFLFVERR
jgi:hypothetical protein